MRLPAAEPLSDAELAATRRDLHLFVAAGIRPDWLPVADGATWLPAALYPYRDARRVRSDFPVLVADSETARELRSLRAVIDDLADEIAIQVGENGEGADAVRHLLLRLESLVRHHVETYGPSDLADAWKVAREAVSESVRSRSTAASMPEHLELIDNSLPVAARLLPCSRQTVEFLFARETQALAERRHEAARAFSQAVAERLRNLLVVEEGHGEAAVHPDALKNAVGATDADEIDFSAMSALLRSAPRAAGLDETQRRRVSDLLQGIETALDRLSPRPQADSGNGSIDRCLVDLQEADGLAAENRSALVDLVAAVHEADLVVENRYDERRHRAFLDALSWDLLGPSERALLPPTATSLRSSELEPDDLAHILALIAGDADATVLVTVDKATAGSSPRLQAATRIAELAMQLGTAFVRQTAASDVEGVLDGIRGVLERTGPSLLVVYTGPEDAPRRVPSYLHAASAIEGRALPAFGYDPEAGRELAAQFHLPDTSSPNATWPEQALEVEESDEGSSSLSVAFTYADFVFLNEADDDLFGFVPPERWTPAMQPLDAYIEAPGSGSSERIPFVWVVRDDGTLGRLVVKGTLVEACRERLLAWRRFQELGGIGNSYAAAALADERLRLEEEKRIAVEAARAEYEQKLDQTTSELARKIVSNIAASLLDVPVSGGPAPASGAARATPPAPSAARSEPEEPPLVEDIAPKADEEEEDALALDEAYIETPRCTSCNECTTINSRMFAYNENKQAYIKDINAGTYRELVMAAEACPVAIIHPGKPVHPDESGLDELVERAKRFN